MATKYHGNKSQITNDDDLVTQELLKSQVSAGDETMTVTQISTVLPLENGVQLKEFNSLDPDKAAVDIQISNECTVNVDDNEYDRGPCVRCMERIENKIRHAYGYIQPFVDRGYKVVLLLLYAAYFIYCMYYRFGDEGSIVLIVGTAIFVLYLAKKHFLSPARMSRFSKQVASSLSSSRAVKSCTITRYVMYFLTAGGLALFLGFNVIKDNPDNTQSLIGIAVIILSCVLVSKRPSRINWHPVFWGFVIQFVFAIVTLRTEFGYSAFKWVGDLVQRLVEFADSGSAFVLGPDFKAMGLAFAIVGIIVFFNAIIALLTHWGVMEAIIINVGTFLGMCLQTGPVESANAVANIFMGYSEVSLLIRPYLPSLSKSEICAVMTGGFASVSGGVLGIFILFGAPANHLMTAAVISAPAALALTKIVYPETESVDVRLQTNLKLRDESDTGRNALSVVSDGATLAVKIAGNIMANMLAFVSLLTMMDAMLGWFGHRAGVQDLTFDLICSYLLYPLAYVMGAAPADCGRVGSLIGTKLFATPMVGYAELGKLIKNRHTLEDYIREGNGTWYTSGHDIVLEALNVTLVNGIMSEKSEIITTYAMCGFSAFTSMGICIGAMTSLCPSRKGDIIQLVVISFFAGNMASFATGAVAGVMYTQHSS